jgi:hypothetical protein
MDELRYTSLTYIFTERVVKLMPVENNGFYKNITTKLGRITVPSGSPENPGEATNYSEMAYALFDEAQEQHVRQVDYNQPLRDRGNLTLGQKAAYGAAELTEEALRAFSAGLNAEQIEKNESHFAPKD